MPQARWCPLHGPEDVRAKVIFRMLGYKILCLGPSRKGFSNRSESFTKIDGPTVRVVVAEPVSVSDPVAETEVDSGSDVVGFGRSLAVVVASSVMVLTCQKFGICFLCASWP